MTLVLCCIYSMLSSQTMMVRPHGISPRDASASSEDIFDRSYNGLLNVGIETKMYLKGTFEDSTLSTAAAWTLVTKPTGSAAVVGDTSIVTVDSTGQIIAFTPDVAGTYKVAFSEGSTYSDTVTINAGTYVGGVLATDERDKTGFTGTQCGTCHQGEFAKWQETGHYDIFEGGMKGTVSSHYGGSCVGCHTTGYDSDAGNNGFDDRKQTWKGAETAFVFPDSTSLVDDYGSADTTDPVLFPAVWDSLFSFFPNSMQLARIQCESCHGPGSAHLGVTADSKMVSSLSADNCAWCHDSGTHHVYPEQWDVSVHANPQHPYTRSSCAPCHNGAGFIAFVKGGKVGLSEDMPENVPITCATCHDPHDNANEHQLRTVEVTLSNDEEVVGGGLGRLCMNCHKSRRNAALYTGVDFGYSSHYGPHHGPQADMLIGTNVPTFGKKLPTSPHFSATENACVNCHMAEGHADDEGNVLLAGSHSFSMTDPNGVDNVKACEECHGDIGEEFGEKRYYFNGNADHDGDGVEEGLKEEIEGLMDALALMIPPIDSSAVDVSGTYIYTETEAKAAYNYLFVEEDRSHGVHNPAFAVALLRITIQALKNNAIEGEIVAIDDVPNDQGKQVKIIWDKFVDDGIAVDPIRSYTVKRFDDYDTTWTGAGRHLADGSWRYALVVPTLFDSTIVTGQHLTKFKVVAISSDGTVFESEAAEGYSVDNLVPQAPPNLITAVVNQTVELSWEAPSDPDINYYEVYRSTNPGFTADETTLIGTTVDLTWGDEGLAGGTYYYKVAAVDFSGNKGDISDEVSAEVLSIGDEALPLEYALMQNFPNPFNPVTTIKFSMPENGFVTLMLFNSIGQISGELINKEMQAGRHSITFNGSQMSSGIYFYIIRVNDFRETKKMVLVK